VKKIYRDGEKIPRGRYIEERRLFRERFEKKKGKRKRKS